MRDTQLRNKNTPQISIIKNQSRISNSHDIENTLGKVT